MLKKIWEWLKKWWRAIAGALVAVLGVLFVWRRQRVGRLKDELAAARAKDEINVLKAFKAKLLEEGNDVAGEIEILDAEIHKNKRAIVEAHENAEGLTDDQVEAEFARLGY